MIEDQLWPVFAVLSVFALLGVSIAYMVRSQPSWRISESQYRNIVELSKRDAIDQCGAPFPRVVQRLTQEYAQEQNAGLAAWAAERDRRRATCKHKRALSLDGGHRLCLECTESLCVCCRDDDAKPGDAA